MSPLEASVEITKAIIAKENTTHKNSLLLKKNRDKLIEAFSEIYKQVHQLSLEMKTGSAQTL